jgi:hypothetical protein
MVSTWILFIIGVVVQTLNHRGESIQSLLPETTTQDKEEDLDLSKTISGDQRKSYVALEPATFLDEFDIPRQSPIIPNGQAEQGYGLADLPETTEEWSVASSRASVPWT